MSLDAIFWLEKHKLLPHDSDTRQQRRKNKKRQFIETIFWLGLGVLKTQTIKSPWNEMRERNAMAESNNYNLGSRGRSNNSERSHSHRPSSSRKSSSRPSRATVYERYNVSGKSSPKKGSRRSSAGGRGRSYSSEDDSSDVGTVSALERVQRRNRLFFLRCCIIHRADNMGRFFNRTTSVNDKNNSRCILDRSSITKW